MSPPWKAALATAVATLALTAPALGAAITAPAGYSVTPLATAPAGSHGPDDLALLSRHVFVGYQNGVGTTGGGNSTLVEYALDGSTVTSWTLAGKIDGIGADRHNSRLIVTVNEDGNSSLYTVDPRSGLVTHYTYSPAPDAATGTSDNTTSSGGGTDSVVVLPDGQILTSASNPQTLLATATFRVVLSSANVAQLQPTFADDAAATLAPGGSATTLGLTDPDSNAFVPPGSPRYGGDYLLDSQGDQVLVFAPPPSNGGGAWSNLVELPLQRSAGGSTTSAGVDDVRFTGGEGGTLFVIDNKGGSAGTGELYAIDGPFSRRTPFASLDTVGSGGAQQDMTTEVDQLDTATGVMTPFATGFTAVKGLAWLPGQGASHGDA